MKTRKAKTYKNMMEEIKEGVNLYNRGFYVESYLKFKGLVNQGLHNIDLLYNIAAVCLKMGLFNEARRYLKTLFNLEEATADLKEMMISSFVNQGLVENAIAFSKEHYSEILDDLVRVYEFLIGKKKVLILYKGEDPTFDILSIKKSLEPDYWVKMVPVMRWDNYIYNQMDWSDVIIFRDYDLISQVPGHFPVWRKINIAFIKWSDVARISNFRFFKIIDGVILDFQSTREHIMKEFPDVFSSGIVYRESKVFSIVPEWMELKETDVDLHGRVFLVDSEENVDVAREGFEKILRLSPASSEQSNLVRVEGNHFLKPSDILWLGKYTPFVHSHIMEASMAKSVVYISRKLKKVLGLDEGFYRVKGYEFNNETLGEFIDVVSKLNLNYYVKVWTKIHREKIEKVENRETDLVFENSKRNFTPRVSVVTCVYYPDETLEDLYQSLLRQSAKNIIEWVIIDDSPGDPYTEQIVRDFCEENRINIRFYRNRENYGPNCSFDIGIRLAKADVVFTISQDDFLIDGEKIEKELEILENREADFVVSDAFITGEALHSNPVLNKTPEEYIKFAKEDDKSSIIALTFIRNRLIGPTAMMKKISYLKSGGYDCFFYKATNDLDVFLRGFLVGMRMEFSNCLWFYRLRNDQQTSDLKYYTVMHNLLRMRLLNFLIKEENFFFLKKVILRYINFSLAYINSPMKTFFTEKISKMYAPTSCLIFKMADDLKLKIPEQAFILKEQAYEFCRELPEVFEELNQLSKELERSPAFLEFVKNYDCKPR